MNYSQTAAGQRNAELRTRAAHWAAVLEEMTARFAETDRQTEALIAKTDALMAEVGEQEARWAAEDARLEALYGPIETVISQA
jgi:uncharacterized coiled-coil protein SlyX